jgi:hypothetical protein
MTTIPDFRALCAELVEICKHDLTYTQTMELVARAEAALATPPPEPPTDEELRKLWLDLYATYDGPTIGEVVEIARAVLERWGHG